MATQEGRRFTVADVEKMKVWFPVVGKDRFLKVAMAEIEHVSAVNDPSQYRTEHTFIGFTKQIELYSLESAETKHGELRQFRDGDYRSPVAESIALEDVGLKVITRFKSGKGYYDLLIEMRDVQTDELRAEVALRRSLWGEGDFQISLKDRNLSHTTRSNWGMSATDWRSVDQRTDFVRAKYHGEIIENGTLYNLPGRKNLEPLMLGPGVNHPQALARENKTVYYLLNVSDFSSGRTPLVMERSKSHEEIMEKSKLARAEQMKKSYADLTAKIGNFTRMETEELIKGMLELFVRGEVLTAEDRRYIEENFIKTDISGKNLEKFSEFVKVNRERLEGAVLEFRRKSPKKAL